MIANGEFPAAIIVMDNRDGHLGKRNLAEEWQSLPTAYVLIEGHNRFNISLYLESTGRLRPTVKVWLMSSRDR